jgi:hypothetical protein
MKSNFFLPGSSNPPIHPLRFPVSIAITGVIHLFVFAMIVCSLRADMEQRVVICFLSLKGLFVSDIEIELASVYVPVTLLCL